jgi:hypothetical protein
MARSGPVSRSLSIAGSAGARPAGSIGADLPSPSISNAPSLEYRQHHDVAPPQIDGLRFHPAWLVRSRLLALQCRTFERRS